MATSNSEAKLADHESKKRLRLQRTILLDADNAEKDGDFYPSYLAHFTGNLKNLYIREGYTADQIDAEIMVLRDNGYILGNPRQEKRIFCARTLPSHRKRARSAFGEKRQNSCKIELLTDQNTSDFSATLNKENV